ncbi:MAG: cytochrome c biogenesis protein CcdA [Rhodothermales bacterium]
MPSYRITSVFLVALLALGFSVEIASPALAQGPASEYVSWKSTLAPAEASAGDLVTLRLDATIAKPWKMYAVGSPSPSYPLRFKLNESPAGFAVEGDLRQREPTVFYDEAFQKEVLIVKEHTFLEADVRVGAGAPAGPTPLAGTVTFVICNDETLICLPPSRTPFEASLTLSGTATGAVSTPAASPQTPALAENAAPAPAGPAVESLEIAPVRSGGLWGFILLAIGAGLGALLMPCVFPMIPLTVSYFTKHAHDRGEAVRMALVYGLSIVGLFTGLGLLMALLLGASGAQTIAANPWINLFIGLVFVAFALSLLGLFELRLPNGMLNFFNRQSNEQKGYVGVVFMGATLALVSFSCTAPFVGTLLAATTVGQWNYPALGMVIFSATFAAPFVLFALFPSGLSRLPASGSWMSSLKVAFGFIELAAALKFLSNADLVWGWNIISRPLAIALSVVIFFLAGLYLLGKIRLAHDEALEQIGTGRLLAAIAFLGVSLYLIPGLFGAPLNRLDAFLPPRKGTDMSLTASFVRSEASNASSEGWFEEIEPAFAQARETGKPVFIDFTGYTCTNCRQMEANVFPHPEVARQFDDEFVTLRLYTDDLDAGPDLQRYQLDLTGTVALPTYAIVDPTQNKLIARVSGVVAVDRFVAFLNDGRANYEAARLAMR